MTLPVALTGTDVIGQAKTGTGKTLGFGLPLLERVTVPADVEAGRAAPEALTDAPQALVVVPTRELCVQVTNDLLTAGKARNVRVLSIYGGRAYEPQVEALKKGVDVVVGTPGRLLDLAGQKKLNLKHVKCLVLDEADEMLDLGFLPDVERIIGMLPVKRQTMLFSATMPGAVIGLARRYMSQPTHIRATAPDDEGVTVANIKQFVYRAHSMDKPEMVARILQADGRGLAMIFCRTKRTAADIAEQLQRRGFASGSVHGDLGQGAREQALRAFRNGKVDVLVCTDVAARGIDVEGVTHVINYQSPEDEKTYLHRIGRTGRAGAKGTAITLVDWDDVPRWQLINKALELDFNDPPETYSTSPHLFSELGIPEGIKGVLPRSERTRAGLEAEELEDLGETGGRGGRGRGGRGGRGEARPAEREHDRERERPARTPRRRRRTRSGAPLDPAAGTASGTDQSGTAVSGTESDAPSAGSPASEESGTRTPRRRRRMRNGVPAQPVTGAEAAVPSASDDTRLPEQAGEAAVTTAEGPALDTVEAPAEALSEAPAKPRLRTRKTAAATAVDTADGTAAAETAGTATEEPAAKPRRRTRKTAEAAPAAESGPVAEDTDVADAEAKPRRRTRKPAAKAVEVSEAVAPEIPAQAAAAQDSAAVAVADSVEAVESKPRRRTRKAAEPAEAPVTAEGAESKPRRTRKATATTAPADAAEGAEAKPRRTRKTAAAAEATAGTAAETAVDTAEGAAPAATKPRRTRKATTAAPEVTEAAADQAEAKPRRRTRKATTAAAEAVADTAEGATAEAKPRRRTRKAAATEPVAPEIPAQATAEPEAEAKPRRRTRKATAKAAEAAESAEA
ncbi:DEAD/DEAH box helicase [Streptomyces anandii]|uniref:DEAD/DEAH box helicase n=1 Tax=Streptomyces anandii TaxID=285454 RepID=UPI001E2ACD69|nr:DEAD/DEAH box helicase [Streptomyces anandii]